MIQFPSNEIKLLSRHCRKSNGSDLMLRTSYFSPTLTVLAALFTSTCASASLSADAGSSSSSPGTTSFTSVFVRKSLANSVMTAHLRRNTITALTENRHSCIGGLSRVSSGALFRQYWAVQSHQWLRDGCVKNVCHVDAMKSCVSEGCVYFTVYQHILHNKRMN